MQITRSFLREAGLGALPDDAVPGYLANLQQRLWRAIAKQLAASLTTTERARLAALMTAGDPQHVESWVERHVPDARAVIDREFEALRARVRLDAEAILALEALASPAQTAAAHEYRSVTGPRRFSF